MKYEQIIHQPNTTMKDYLEEKLKIFLPESKILTQDIVNLNLIESYLSNHKVIFQLVFNNFKTKFDGSGRLEYFTLKVYFRNNTKQEVNFLSLLSRYLHQEVHLSISSIDWIVKTGFLICYEILLTVREGESFLNSAEIIDEVLNEFR